MPYYEHIFIARQDISATQVDSLGDAMTEVITTGGGEVKKKEYWGLKNLAYRIKKNRKGHYVLMNLDAPVDSVKEMERQLRLNEDVLRFLTLRVDELEEGPSVVMQGRGSRDERGGRGGRRDERGGRRRDGEPAEDREARPEKPAAAAEAGKAEPAKAEPAKTEAEPAKAEPAKAEPAKTEAAKTEAEPAKTEAEPAKAEAEKAEKAAGADAEKADKPEKKTKAKPESGDDASEGD